MKVQTYDTSKYFTNLSVLNLSTNEQTQADINSVTVSQPSKILDFYVTKIIHESDKEKIKISRRIT